MRFGAGPLALAVYPASEGYNTSMPFGDNPMSRIYPMPVDHWQHRRKLGYNTLFTGSAGPTYPIMMGQHHQNRNYFPQAYNARYAPLSTTIVGPTYPMGPSQQHQYQNHVPRGYNAAPFIAGPLYPMGQHTNHQYQNRSQAGPRRNQRKRHRKAEPHTQYHKHESSGTVVKDRSTGVDPGMARISTSNETRAGKVWRTPSENLLMANCNLTSQ